MVNETVIAVGYNDDFVIVKQSPEDKDTVLYYVIDVNEIKKEREKFVAKTDTTRYWSNYTDISGRDSPGPEQIYISTAKFSPKNAVPLTLEGFRKKRKQLNIPDSLDFTISYEQSRGNEK